MRIVKLFVFTLVFLFSQCASAVDLYFSNFLWHVRDGFGGPGPNNWSNKNAWVDANGWLHLKISKIGNKWYCPEIVTDKRLGFGEYWFYTIGLLTDFDQNLVLGLFHYTTSDIGPDGTNEIDIEFSHWGNPSFPPGGYTVYPAVPGPSPANKVFNFGQTGTYTTHGFVWNSKNILFRSGHGHYVNYPNLIFSWNYAPADFTKAIPQRPMPLHLNFWLLKGMAPTNGQSKEIIIKKVCYKPLVGVGNC